MIRLSVIISVSVSISISIDISTGGAQARALRGRAGRRRSGALAEAQGREGLGPVLGAKDYTPEITTYQFHLNMSSEVLTSGVQ